MYVPDPKAAAFVGNVGSFLVIDHVERRSLLGVSVLCASLSAFLFAFSAKDNSSPTTIIAAACLFQISDTAAWNVVDTVSTEQFPKRQSKATGFGICSATGRLGAFAAQFVNGSLIGGDGGMNGGATELLIVDGLMLMLCAVGTWGLDERVRYLDDDNDEDEDANEPDKDEEANLVDFVE
ncbi:hypothetical protein TrVE_jg7031 [Triparma verrucosa]|uniref:Major facilitator superfamily (MFS) profile domain-containing protein n=1 Tax=Triparma verrucosa TaxID=1606542 RepID=A0A9W7F5L6_9STRA|nr:hypothetical protein TrVE_jg7031 [Triparma verrucosa]